MKASHEIVDFREFNNVLLHDNNSFEAYQRHWHTSVEIIMPIDSDYEVLIGSECLHICDGDILIIAPGVVHSIPARHGRRYIMLADFTYLLSQNFASILSLIQPAYVISKENCPSIYDECQKLFLCSAKEYFGSKPFRDIAVASSLLSLFLLVGRSFSEPAPEHSASAADLQPDTRQRFIELCEYVSTHCCEELTVDMAAGMTGFSKYHFSRLFKKFAGTSFYRYVNVCRISYAALLLQNPENSIMEVAISSGYNSAASFIRLFKDIKACTPTEFRSMLIKNNQP